MTFFGGGTYPPMTRTCLKSPFQGLSEHTLHTPYTTYLRPRNRYQPSTGFMRLKLWLYFWGVSDIYLVVDVGNLLGILYQWRGQSACGGVIQANPPSALVAIKSCETVCPDKG